MLLQRSLVGWRYQAGSIRLMGRNESTAAPYGIPACGRSMSGLVATTLDHAQKMMATPNAMAAMGKLVILRMSASLIGPRGIRPIKDSLGRSSRLGCDAHHQNTFFRPDGHNDV